MRKVILLIGTVMLLIFMPPRLLALTVEELLHLKQAGVSDETLRFYILLELDKVRAQSMGPGRTVGQRTIVGSDGKKRIVTYSIEDPEMVLKERVEREELERRSWDMLQNLIIDARNGKEGGK